MSTHKHTDILVALAGQPNSGKSTIFSQLSGLYQKVGNYPGVTVEKKSGHFHAGKQRVEIVDLPGTYSLTSFTQEEKVTRDFIFLERPEVVVIVLDASNFRRHLYLVLQILEMQIPAIVCLNMSDVAKRRGFKIDAEKAKQLLGVPVIATNGSSGEGIDELKDAILKIAAQTDHEPTNWRLDYGDDLERFLLPLTAETEKRQHLIEDFSARWIAVKLMQDDRDARRIVQHHTHDDSWQELLNFAENSRKEHEEQTKVSPLKIVAESLNKKAESIEKECLVRLVPPKRRVSDRIDAVVCHRIYGLFVVALVLFLTFQLVFWATDGPAWIPGIDGVWRNPVELCAYLFEECLPFWADKTFGWTEESVSSFRSLIHDGILAGVGGVLQFLPLIFAVFIAVAVLEQCGFVARISVVLDRLVRRFGLNGQAVLPLILGGGIMGGCAVPAILATRTMREQKERLLTILVVPMMNCGAKIPVYAMLIAAFFSAYQAFFMAFVIFASWSGALFSAWLLSKTFVKGNSMPLFVEMPSYLLPNPTTVLAHALSQCWHFIYKAGTLILFVSVLLWALMYFPVNDTEHSYAGRIGKSLTPISQFAGFDWQDNVALLGGFAAKEVIVSSLLTIYSLEDDTQLREYWSTPKALAFLLFVMFYAPCSATCITIWRETKSFRMMMLALAFSTAFAFLLAVVVYQVGNSIKFLH